MNIVVILPTPEMASEAVRYWQQRRTSTDRLHVLSIVGSLEQPIDGVEIHPLEIDEVKGRQWQHRVPRTIGWRLVSRGIGIWHRYLSSIWTELLWTIQSFDPDIIDLRWFQGKDELVRRLRENPWCVVASDKDVPNPENSGTSWRAYDPGQKVSIVLPIYNGEPFLRQSIESCLEQTHRNIELVIVDDCSKDNSASIIAEYAARDSRIVAIRNAANKRLPESLNVGFAATSGQLLSWTSHDNYYEPTAIEALVRYLCTWKDVDLVYSDYMRIEESEQMPPGVNVLPPPWTLPFGNVVGAYFLYRRKVYESVGNYRGDMEYAEDYDYWVRVYKNGHSMMRLRDPLYNYRMHADSMTSHAAKMVDKPHTAERVRREYFEKAR